MHDYDLSAYLSVFLDELDEQIQILDEKILELEKDPFNCDIVQVIFRAAHTLKGSSASMGFEKLKQFTHHFENVFEQIRQKRLVVTTELIDVLFAGIDMIKQMKIAILNEQLDELETDEIIQVFEQFSQGMNEQQSSVSFEQPALESYHTSVLLQGMQQGYFCYFVKVDLLATCQMKNVRAFMVHNYVAKQGEIILTTPSIERMEQDESFNGQMGFYILTMNEKQLIEKELAAFTDVASCEVQVLEQSNLLQVPEEEKTETTSKDELHTKVSPTIRVDIDKLEHLMGLVGELVINQTRLVDVRGRFSEKDIRHESEFDVLNEVTNQLSLVISELQDGMMQTRMLPIEHLFNRFPRLVRDTSIRANKEIDFEMIGKDTELDRTLIEEISDPLIHLIRNAIDHGIEPAEQRQAVGKPLKGKVTLSATHEEKHVVIKIQDDGRGIDPQKIKQVSVQKGLITQDEANKLNDKEAMFLIFKSGISTAKKITDISGRGVGMDIVKSHIEKINGLIDIDSVVGQGTTFTIKLPLTLTLSIIRALLIKFGEKTFAIPLVNVLEIIRINKEDIQKVNDQEVGVVRGRVLPLIRMKEKLHIDETVNEEVQREFVVVIGFAEKRVGIIVDKTIGNQEIVTKQLGEYIGSVPFISGATIMGDANVALILDVPLIIKEFGSQVVETQTEMVTQRTTELNQLVTFKIDNEEYGIEIQRAKDIIPVPKITTIVDSSPEVLGIMNLRGKTLPVVDLRKRMHLPQIPHTNKTRIIVVEYEQQDIGLLVDEVKQVFKVETTLTPEQQANESYHASNLVENVSKIGDRMILKLDFNEVFKTIRIKISN